MMRAIQVKTIAALAAAFTLVGCATTQQPEFDYTAYKESNPKSILVLPPTNESPEVIATYGVLSQVTHPLAEAGYYVLPVAVVDEVFKQNGLTHPNEMHDAPTAKLQEIFGADAALFINITQYGTSYKVVDSATEVSVEGTLIDLHTGQKLWSGSARASSAENRGQSSGLGILIAALANQIIDTASDRGFDIAGIATWRMLSPTKKNGILYGPRSSQYEATP